MSLSTRIITLLFVSLLPLLSFAQTTAEEFEEKLKGSYTNMNPLALYEMLDVNPGIVLDVRTDKEVKEGIIEGAVHIDFYDEQFKEKAAKLDTTKNIYVYCRGGGRSMKASTILLDCGFRYVYNLEGGITAWKDMGLPTVAPKE